MTKLTASMTRAAAIATLVGGVTLAGATFAAPSDSTMPVEPPNSTINLDSHGDMTGSSPDTSSTTTPDSTAAMAPSSAAPMEHKHWDHAGAMKHENAQQMQAHVEERIKMLHAKLKITKDQEPAWNDVANAMRSSESKVAQLVQERNQNAGSMSAVDDMQSYQQIAQAHADGFGQVIAAFKTLYNSMSDAQKKNADMVFGSYQHHGMHHHDKKTAN